MSIPFAMGAKTPSGGTNWLRWIFAGAGALSSLLGLLVLIGWYSRNVALIQVHPAFVPMQYNTALGFLLCGAAFLLILLGRDRSAAAIAGIAGLVGLLTLFEYVSGVNLGIDQLLMKHYITILTSHPGRMAPNTALCFLLTAVFISLFMARVRATWISWASGTLAALVLVLGLTALVGYLSGMSTAFGWGNLTRMAVHTSAGFCILGIGALAHCWRNDAKEGFPEWFPLVAGIGVMAIAVGIWQVQVAREQDQLHQLTQAKAETGASDTRSRHRSIVDALDRMARRWGARGGTPREEWRQDAASHVDHIPAFQAIEWVDPTFHVRWIEPLKGNEAAQGLNLAFEERRRAALEAAQAQRAPTVTRTVKLVQGGTGFLVYVPIYTGEKIGGFILGVLDVERFVSPVLNDVGKNFAVRFADGEQTIFTSHNWSRAKEEFAENIEVSLRGGVVWKVTIAPTEDFVGSRFAPLRWTLGVGILLALLAALAIHFAQKSRLRAKEIARHRLYLEKLVDERTHELKERVKELQCLYAAHIVMADADKSIESILQEVAERLPETWQYPAVACARITFEDQDHRTSVFREAGDVLSAPIFVGGNELGRIEVRYLEPRPVADEGPFLREEREVLDNLAATIGLFVERRRAVEELRRHRDDLEELVAERTKELQRSNKELEQFAYVASHDLQEPLRMVASYVQLIQRRYGGKLDEEADEFIEYAVDGANRMQKLINDLLVFSRVRTRGEEFQETNCEEVLESALGNLRMAIQESGSVVTHDPLPVVSADRTQLVQLFQNLIGNAIKFRSDDHPKIHVSAQENGREWVFSVRDNGIGFDPEHKERIFVIFQRLHSRGKYPGTGIGLAVCKRIVERHVGSIWVESAPGQGSTFYFTIPKAQEVLA